MRSSDHPPATLECEQLRLPVMLPWLVGFGTILAVLAMLLRTACSRFDSPSSALSCLQAKIK